MPLRTDRGLLHVGGVLNESEIADCLSNSSKLDFYVLPIDKHFVSSNNGRWEASIPNDALLSSNKWACVYFTVSPNLFLHHDNPQDRYAARTALEEQVQWAAYCGARGIICPKHFINADPLVRLNYASAVGDLAKQHPQLIFLFQIPIWLEGVEDTWVLWDEFRTAFGLSIYSGTIAVALEVTKLPIDFDEDQLLPTLARWRGEAIRLLILNQSSFQINRLNFPALPRLLQTFTLTNMKSLVPVALLPASEPRLEMSIKPCDDQESPAKSVLSGFQEPCIERSWLTNRREFLINGKQVLFRMWDQLPRMNDDEKARHGYYDVIQAPLQPLADNLEAASYEMFELDAIKYDLYQEAFKELLSKPQFKQRRKLHIAYCGAGRGALYDRLFRVLRELGFYDNDTFPSELILSAVEKNPNAARTLRSRVLTDPETIWRHVTVVEEDMRTWNPPQPIDIALSELLGSFGDNELSPECLNGVQKHLSPDGVIIPYEYRSFIQPISASKVYNSVHRNGALEKGHVVHLDSYYALSEEGAQPCFEFVHPNNDPLFDPNTNVHNMRIKQIKWTAETAAICHGFAGYFSAKLTDNVICSITPQEHSPGMSSWFPLFLPLINPIRVKAGDSIHLTIKRLTRPNMVWYEWTAGKQNHIGILHNAGGHEWSQIF